MSDAPEFSDLQRQMMLHAIGAGEGKGPYRNRYFLYRGSDRQPAWDDLVARGYAGFEDMPPVAGLSPDDPPTPSKQRCYWLTEKALFHPDLHRGQKPVLVSSMYFSYDGHQRAGVTAKTTFDAILLGQRTSTTRFRKWGGTDKWAAKEAGTLVRFHADKLCKSDEYVDVVITAVENIDLRWCAPADRERWSRCEGWTESQGQTFGMRNGNAVWVHYKLLTMSPGAEKRLERAKAQIAHEAEVMARLAAEQKAADEAGETAEAVPERAATRNLEPTA